MPKTSPLRRAMRNAFVAMAYSCLTIDRSSFWTLTAEKPGRYRKYVMARPQRLPVIKNDISNATIHCFGVSVFTTQCAKFLIVHIVGRASRLLHRASRPALFVP